MNNFSCYDGTKVPISQFCNGVKNCSDGSDERNIFSSFQSENYKEIECRPILENVVSNYSCLIHFEYICNGDVFCKDLTPCDINCVSHYQCLNTTRCVPRSTVCDGNSCNGCEEDHDWGTGTGFFCIRGGRDCILPQQLLFDDVKDCDGGEDLCFVNKGNEKIFDSNSCFKCLQNKTIIPRSKVCDHVIDCPDLSDECLCEGNVPKVCEYVNDNGIYNQNVSRGCEIGDVSCGDGSCIPRWAICDGIKDCHDARDESHDICKGTLPCKHGTYLEANQTCRCDRPCKRAYGVLCNGRGECPIPLLNDEIHRWEEEPGYPDDECYSSCFHPGVPHFDCTSPLVSNIQSFDYDVTFCQIEVPLGPPFPPLPINQQVSGDKICDGIVHCPVTEEDESEERCKNRFRCRSGIKVSIPLSSVCDGVPDCDDVSDEINNFCPERFFCPALNNWKISIERKLVCDFYINCDDGSDEMNCREDGRFYCESGSPLFVSKRQIMDGRGDCLDWSDECPLKSKFKNEDVFSSRYELIANPVLRILVWIMGTAAVFGNLCVLFGESRTIFSLRKKSTSSTLLCNHMLVLNLALADFLMGIYLIILGVVGAMYSGTFCAHKLEWLSGPTCSALGVLVMTSSEASVITLVLLTSFRLYAVWKPFQSADKPGALAVACLIISSWACSLCLALLPLSHFFEDLFVHEAVLYDNPFFENIAVDFRSATKFVKQLRFYGRKEVSLTVNSTFSAESWEDLREIVTHETNYPDYLMTSHWIGYYSANSVCIPKLFVTQDVAAWSFSFSVMLFNFVSFVYVSLAYFIIFVASKRASSITKQRNRRRNHLSNTLQRRIIRLVATDFCCWVPVSVMTFLSFGGTQLPEIAYVISAAVLLPINSALNPILYSNFLDRYAERAWTRTATFSATLRTTSAHKPSSAATSKV